MADRIVLVDPVTNQVQHLDSVAFTDLRVKERQNLQNWVLQNPEVLGEPLLVVTPEFGHFDRSKRRLDILALDKVGHLVVVELKLDTGNSLADLQAIRYAAFCSTMQTEDMVRELADHEGVGEDEAEEKILDFLGTEALPDLAGEPRIILAAGSINNEELTSCVLWLRRFAVDITCVELTPYKLPDSEKIMLVPRVIIPLPEARDYLVSVERKAAAKRSNEERLRPNETLWRVIAESFNALGLPFEARSTKSTRYSRLTFGDPNVHYEWKLRRRQASLEVALHFEDADAGNNLRLLGFVSAASKEIAKGVPYEFEAAPWGRKWAMAYFLLPFDDVSALSEITDEAASIMRTLIERTWPLIRGHVRANDELLRFPENG